MITLFFDLDGVLADFVHGALALHGRPDADKTQVPWDMAAHLGIDPKEFWAPMGYDFWAGLAPYPDGTALFRRAEALVGRDRIALVSSPCHTPGCDEGKRAWVRRHLPGYERSCFLGGEKWKLAAPTKLLIDDHDANREAFLKAGGRAMRVPRPWNAGRAGCPDGLHFDADRAFGVLRGVLFAAGDPAPPRPLVGRAERSEA